MHFLQEKQAIRSLLEISLTRYIGDSLSTRQAALMPCFDVSKNYHGTVAIGSTSRRRNSCSFRAVKVYPVMLALWNQVISDNCLFQDDQSIP